MEYVFWDRSYELDILAIQELQDAIRQELVENFKSPHASVSLPYQPLDMKKYLIP
jgi:hypothetical protein